MSGIRWELTENPSSYSDYYWYADELPARKFYLFLAEIGHRLRHLMTDPAAVAMLDYCEQCGEGKITEDELSDLSDSNRPSGSDGNWANSVADYLHWWVADRYKVSSRSVYAARDAFAVLAAIEAGLLPPDADQTQVAAIEQHPIFTAARERTDQEWGKLVRDIYGPDPFRPVPFSPAWRTPTAVALARTIYESRDFAALPILADALEEAGCDQPAVLAHCRDASLTHVRGCWVVDLVLGKG